MDRQQSGIQDILANRWSEENISRKQCKKRPDCLWWWFGNDGFL